LVRAAIHSNRLGRAAGVLALGAAVLGACSNLPEHMAGVSQVPVDPNSPIAQNVIQASQTRGPFPKFRDIPAIPTDQRPASYWRTAVKDTQKDQQRLQTQVAALPPVDTGTAETYAAQARNRLGAPPSDIPPPDSRQRTEAEAEALRERATPPPPPQ
jgi:hypothetical protein